MADAMFPSFFNLRVFIKDKPQQEEQETLKILRHLVRSCQAPQMPMGAPQYLRQIHQQQQNAAQKQQQQQGWAQQAVSSTHDTREINDLVDRDCELPGL